MKVVHCVQYLLIQKSWNYMSKKIHQLSKEITRVWLWEAYQLNKYRIWRKNKGIVNEL